MFRNETEPHGPRIGGIVQECGSKRAQLGKSTVHDAMANPKLSHHHLAHFGHIKRPPAMIYNEEQRLWQVESGRNCRTFESRRRAVTKEERDRAMENARSLQTQHPSVAVLMKPSHVYRGHWLVSSGHPKHSFMFMFLSVPYPTDTRFISTSAYPLPMPQSYCKRKENKGYGHDRIESFPGHMAQVQTCDEDYSSAKEGAFLKKVALSCMYSPKRLLFLNLLAAIIQMSIKFRL